MMKGWNQVHIGNNVSFHVVLSDTNALPLYELQKSMLVQDAGGRIKQNYNLKKGRIEDHATPAKKNKSPVSGQM
jgi:hypothetical protein